MVDKDADWTKLWTLVSITFTTNIFYIYIYIHVHNIIYIWEEIEHHSVAQFHRISAFEAL